MAIGIAGGLLAGTAAGLVFGVPGLSSAASDSTPAVVVQQTDETDPSTPAPADTDPAAPAPPDAPDDAPEPGTKLREILQPLVDDGTITAEQADAVTAHLVENRPERGEGGFGGGHGGHRGGPGGMFGRGGPGMGSEVLTDLLGLTAEEIHTQLHDGATLAEIATAQGVEVQAVVDALVGELDTRLDEAVANGRIEQAEANEKLGRRDREDHRHGEQRPPRPRRSRRRCFGRHGGLTLPPTGPLLPMVSDTIGNNGP